MEGEKVVEMDADGLLALKRVVWGALADGTDR